jgi:hypothetical protein
VPARVVADGDPTVFVGRYIRDTVGNGFGLQVVSEAPGSCHYQLTRCTLLEKARARGTTELDICEAHEEFWQTVSRSVVDGPSVRFSPTMRDGHFCCEVRLRGLDVAGRGAPTP